MPKPGECFIVQATGPGGRVRWITPYRATGLRAFGPRELADRFLSWDRAERAIREMRRTDDCTDIEFEVQAVTVGPRTGCEISDSREK